MSGSCMSDGRDLARAWKAILGELQIDIPPASFKTFLEGTMAVGLDGDTIIVEGNRRNVDEVNGKLRMVIEQAAFKALARELSVLFVAKGSAEAGTPADGHPARAGDLPGVTAGQVVGAINRWFTFDRYLAAEGNRMALECCQELLSEGYFHMSPIVVYGRPGLGKTHLLHALASKAARGGWNVACLSAEEFTTRFTGALRTRSADDFRDTFRTVRLFLIDDLQDLEGKKATQEEFVHTMDAVSNGGGCIVAGSEKHPAELDLPERLASRLSAGVAARILPFVAQERRDYIEQLAREQGGALPSWAVDRIAGIEAPSVRVLQGAVKSAITLERLRMLDLARLDAELTRIVVIEAAGNFGDRDLLESVARHFALCFEDLMGHSRKPAVTAARAVAVAALQERGKSLSQIGSLLGRHRSTINELAPRGRKLLEADLALRSRLAG